jgi:hypothetical protein
LLSKVCTKKRTTLHAKGERRKVDEEGTRLWREVNSTKAGRSLRYIAAINDRDFLIRTSLKRSSGDLEQLGSPHGSHVKIWARDMTGRSLGWTLRHGVADLQKRD